MAASVKKYLSLIATIVVYEAISAFIGRATLGDVQGWYATLNKPPLSPPNWLFPVVWTSLYILIASAGWWAWKVPAGKERSTLLALFTVYTALNWGWSFVFFSAHLLLPGFIWILVMNLVALGFIAKAWKSERKAAYLMIPPLLWTSFAAYLNFGYWYFNR